MVYTCICIYTYIERERYVVLLGGERLHDHEKNTCKYVKPFTSNERRRKTRRKTDEEER